MTNSVQATGIGALRPRSRWAAFVLLAKFLFRNARGYRGGQKNAAFRRLVHDAVSCCLRQIAGEPVRAITFKLATSQVDGTRAYEGGGSQLETTFEAIDFARRNHLAYIHTPMRNIDHLPTGMPMAEWAEQWENLFRLSEIGSDAQAAIKPFNWEVLIELDLFALLGAARSPIVSAETAQLLRARFQSPGTAPQPDGRVIAVHIRRGEVTPDTFPDRWMEAVIPIAMTRKIAEAMTQRGHSVHIQVITHDPDLDLSALAAWPVTSWANRDSMASLAAMAAADVLIAAVSSFSKIAGIASEGVVVAPAEYRPLANWVTYDAVGNFDLAAIIARIAD